MTEQSETSPERDPASAGPPNEVGDAATFVAPPSPTQTSTSTPAPETVVPASEPVVAPPPAFAYDSAPPPPAPSSSRQALDRAGALAQERPEVAVGAALGGGLLLAMILKRLAR